MDSVGIPKEEVKLNDGKSLDACKVPPTLEVGKFWLLKAVWQVRMQAMKPIMKTQ